MTQLRSLEREPGKVDASADERAVVSRLMRRRKALQRRDLFLAVLVPIILIASWQVCSTFELVDTRIFSSPSQVIDATGRLLSAGTLQSDTLVTVYRLCLGYLIGCAGGAIFGLAMGYFRAVGAALSPTFAALYSIPKIAVLPVMLVIFGLGETPRVLTVATSTFFVLQINAMDGIRRIDPRLLEAGRAYGARKHKLFTNVILPISLPALFTGLRITAPIALVVDIGCEFVAANNGLGYLIWNSWTLFQPDKMYVGLIASAVVGAVFTGVVVFLSWLALPWQRQARRRRWGFRRGARSNQASI